MKLYEYGVRGVRGAVTTVGFDMFTRQDYLDYFATRNIDSEFPGARGMGVIYRLSKSKVSDFEAAMSADYGEPKVIKSLGENEGEHYVIRFLEPYSRNVNAVGLDIASETNRRVAANFAMETGLATLTGPITVLQAIENKDSAFLLLLPIYAPAVPLETSQQRDEATLGWAYSVLVFNEIVKDVAFSANHLAVQLTDITNPANPEVFSTPRSGLIPAMRLVPRLNFRFTAVPGGWMHAPCHQSTWYPSPTTCPGLDFCSRCSAQACALLLTCCWPANNAP